MRISEAVDFVHSIVPYVDARGRVYPQKVSTGTVHGFTKESAKIFHGVISSRGNKSLLYAYCYNKALTASEKDEILICSRITKAKLGK